MGCIARLMAAAAGLALVALALGLGWAHLQIRRERPPLPAPARLLVADAAAGPVRSWVIHTATQRVPRSLVLEADGDPEPRAGYTMTFPAFALEWADGRLLLVDVGMNEEGARAFGRPLELLPGTGPVEPRGAVAERLGAAGARVSGVVFTHLHADHVGGVRDLCATRDAPLRVFLNQAQAERPNHTTRGGLSLLAEAGCVETRVLSGVLPLAVPGLPGVELVPVAGHTPGSQLVSARVGSGPTARSLVFVGDVVNHVAGIDFDLPKPLFYRTLVSPEDDARLGELRRLLRGVRDEWGTTLVVSHDLQQIEGTGIRDWPSPGPGPEGGR